jgi:hypothetical protein
MDVKLAAAQRIFPMEEGCELLIGLVSQNFDLILSM